MSNVPAAIFLAPFTEDWRALAWGVGVGGFGLAIGSLANLIALRLVRGSRAFGASFTAGRCPCWGCRSRGAVLLR
jgi:Na+/H+ antiporter NhaD/arsenite permease-like protein